MLQENNFKNMKAVTENLTCFYCKEFQADGAEGQKEWSGCIVGSARHDHLSYVQDIKGELFIMNVSK